MKEIISGNKEFYFLKDLIPCHMPKYPECKPENVIKAMKLKENKTFMEFFPELEYKNEPTDREFFYNIVNTYVPHSMEKMKFNAATNRVLEKDIKDEIAVDPKFRDMFESEYSCIGFKGKTI